MDQSGVHITMRDIYEELVYIRQELIPAVTSVKDHEARIRTLERWAYALPPTFLAALATAIFSMLR